MGEIIGVSSVVYNLAGDIADRAGYLKSMVIYKTLSGSKESMADTIVKGYLHGPALKLKCFYRWVSTSGNYNLIGLPTGRLKFNGTVPINKVQLEIPAIAGHTVEVQSAKVSYAMPKYWAEQYMLANHPDLFSTAWKYDYLKSTNQIRIEFVTGPDELFTSIGFDYEAKFLYAYYCQTDDTTDEEGLTSLYIYKIGSGNVDLDAIAQNRADYGEFFPFIPVRLESEFLSSTHLSGAFNQCTEAYKKATGADLDDLIDSISDNESLADIDHAYVTFGVSLNTRENASKQYVYKFFETLQLAQEGGVTAYEDYQTELENYNRGQVAWTTWATNGQIGPRPRRPAAPAPLVNEIVINGTGDINSYYDVHIDWKYIRNFSRNGKGKPGAKKGDLWFVADTKVIGQEQVTTATGGVGSGYTYYEDIVAPRLRLYWQRTSSEYTYLEVIGLQYSNIIYGGHGIFVDPVTAMADADESDFIVPLHVGVWESMNMVDRTQMSTSCMYTVFNCYTARKQKWYETGIFQVLFVIVIAIISAILPGAGAIVGLLGTNLAVGTTLGLTGVTAAIVGSVANALAAMVLAAVIQKVTEGFGAFGALIGTLIGIVVGSVASMSSAGMTSLNWSSLLKVDNLMKLMSSLGDTAVGLVNEATAGIQQDATDFLAAADKKALEIQQAYFEQFGYGNAEIDPMMLVGQNNIKVENSSTFLTRTLMTGSDIVDMSHELLYDFSKYTLELPGPFTR